MVKVNINKKNHETGHDAGLGFDFSCLTCQFRKKTFIASCWETRAINRPESYPLTSFWSSLSDSSHYVSLSFSMIVFTSGVFPLHLWQITIQTLHHGSPILAEICLLLFTWANFLQRCFSKLCSQHGYEMCSILCMYLEPKSLTQMLNVWYIYTYIYHKNCPM